ncbi:MULTISPECIES: hypothetical protein [Bacillus]|uniref:hypothetical protein n=1 Tax=Bacillus TaxID=1386 RepID=UPI001ABDDD49|nr:MULTISPECIES: hypothetical protein [Bacillus subtilis group]MCB4340826.1 hypothetical protein [Bacillus subtilis]MCL9628355.1 hypothetical protein [Bacillus subtilis]QTG87411.1 hypothetical protein J4048_21030 [Bacillus amyloliquefaciens]
MSKVWDYGDFSVVDMGKVWGQRILWISVGENGFEFNVDSDVMGSRVEIVDRLVRSYEEGLDMLGRCRDIKKSYLKEIETFISDFEKTFSKVWINQHRLNTWELSMVG